MSKLVLITAIASFAACSGGNGAVDAASAKADGPAPDARTGSADTSSSTDVVTITPLDAVHDSPASTQDSWVVDSRTETSTDTSPDGRTMDTSPDTGHAEVPHAVCRRASDCTGAAPATVPRCGSSTWSCIAGRCTWDCQSPGRTCDLDSKGCIGCTGDVGPRQCPDQACMTPLRSGSSVESTTCAMVPDFAAWTCFGWWARLKDGSFCAIRDLATGLPRLEISCGACQTVVLW
jgi:hypothetical protein